MSKSKRRSSKSRKNRTRRHYPAFKRRSLARGRNSLARGPNSPISPTAKIDCCMCDKSIARDKTLVPLACLQKTGERAHRICQKCWWDPKSGFGRETAPHGCPGCKRGLPLTAPLKRRTPKSEDVIVISDD